MSFFKVVEESPRAFRSRPASLIVMFTFLACALPASAQELTTELLIDNAVSDVGPRYNDIDQAIQRFKNNDVAGAQRFLELAVEKNPQLPPVEVMLAKMFIVSRSAAGTRASLELAIKNHPKDPEAYLILADQARAAGETAEMEALISMAAPLVEAFDANQKRKRNFLLRVFASRAIAAEARGRLGEAVADLQKWVAEDPESATAHQRLGQALFMAAESEAEYAAAQAELDKAKQLEPKLPNPLVTAAVLYQSKGDEENAKKTFENAVRGDSENADTLKAYGRWLLETNNAAAAAAPLAKARRLEPNAIDTLIYSAIAARINKQYAEAESFLLEALAVSPSNREVINQLATLLIMDADPAKRARALEFAQINAQLYQKESETAYTLAWVYYQLGRRREAQAALKKAQTLGNMGADSSYFVAKIQFDQDRMDAAEALLNQGLRSTNLFVHREEAEALLEQVKKGATP